MKSKTVVGLSSSKGWNKISTTAESALRQALKGHSSVEKRRRLEEIIANLEGKTSSGEWLRAQRALEVLEHIGTPGSRRVLQDLGQGAPESRLTRKARLAMARLAK
jgi:hypothetical protein